MNTKNHLKYRRNHMSFAVIILSVFCMMIGSVIFGNRNVNAYSYSVSGNYIHLDSNNYHYRYFKYTDEVTGNIDHCGLKITVQPDAEDVDLINTVYDDISRNVTITATSDVISGDDIFVPYLSDADGNKVNSYTSSTVLDDVGQCYTNVVYYVTYTVPEHASWASSSIDRPVFSDGDYAEFQQTGVIGNNNHSSSAHKYTIKCNVNLQNTGVMDGIDGKRYWGTSSTDLYSGEWFTVTFMANDGSSDNTTKNVCDGDTYHDLPVIQREGYLLDGWYTDQSGGNRINEDSIVCQDIVVLYAHWKEEVKSYVLKVDPNGGILPNTIFGDKNGTSQAASVTVYYGKGDCNQLGKPTWKNHRFLGYFDSYVNGNRVFDYKGDAVNGNYWDGWYGNAKWKYNGNLTVYARWEDDVYTVNFQKNGGSGSISSRAYIVGVSYNLPSTGYTRNHYTLMGWCKNEYGKGTIYKPGESVSDLASSGSSITLYAIWRRNGAGFIQRPLLDVDMFQGDYSIRGQKGTVYNSEYRDSRYAHIDQSDNPGYFSKK